MIDKAQLTDLSYRLMEDEWLQQRRQHAYDRIENTMLPTYERMPIHTWPIEELNIDSAWSEGATVYDFEASSQNLIWLEEETVLIQALAQTLMDKGVVLMDFASASCDATIAPLMQQYYMQLTKGNKLDAYHEAYMTGGIVVYIPKHVHVQETLHLYLQQLDTQASWIKHILIIADEDSSCTIDENIQHHADMQQVRHGQLTVEVFVKPYATVHYIATEQSANTMTLYIQRLAQVDKDGTYHLALAALNEGRVMSDIDVCLLGDGAVSTQRIVAISRHQDIQWINTSVRQLGAHSDGQIVQRGVVLDEGTLSFNGIGHIQQSALQAKTIQESRLMMLTSKGRGDANPILLIDHDDVVASHAASVGQMDDTSLFYLMSRGLDEQTILRLQTYAFLSPILDMLPTKEWRIQMKQALERKLD